MIGGKDSIEYTTVCVIFTSMRTLQARDGFHRKPRHRPFLGRGERHSLALKQALGLLLTINRIPQLYYGTEVLMNGIEDRHRR